MLKYKKLIDPAFIFIILILGQFVVWFFFMPQDPVIYGLAPKYYSYTSILRYMVLVISFILGLIVGKRYTLKNVYKIKRDYTKYYIKVSIISFYLFLIFDFIYIKPIISNIDSLKYSIINHGVADFIYTVRENSKEGITTFNNIFPYCTAIFWLAVLSDNVDSKLKNKCKKYLLSLFCIIFFQAVFLAQRMFLIYFVLIFMCGYFLKNKNRAISKRVVTCVIGVFIFVIFAEMFRFGFSYAKTNNLDLFSYEVISKTIDYETTAYLASDLNNAFTILDNRSPMRVASTGAPFINSFITNVLDLDSYNYSLLPNWNSLYGTVNVFALWWFDLGYFSILVSVFISFFIGLFYRYSINSQVNPSFANLMYMLLYTGIFCIMRINYYALSIFIIPCIFLFIFEFIKNLLYKDS